MWPGRDRFSFDSPEEGSLHRAGGARRARGGCGEGGVGVGGGPGGGREEGRGGHNRGVGRQAQSRRFSGGNNNELLPYCCLSFEIGPSSPWLGTQQGAFATSGAAAAVCTGKRLVSSGHV